MAKYNAENERIKREYLIYLKAAKGMSEASLDAVAKAIHRLRPPGGIAGGCDSQGDGGAQLLDLLIDRDGIDTVAQQ